MDESSSGLIFGIIGEFFLEGLRKTRKRCSHLSAVPTYIRYFLNAAQKINAWDSLAWWISVHKYYNR
jgi:hypothetical protein